MDLYIISDKSFKKEFYTCLFGAFIIGIGAGYKLCNKIVEKRLEKIEFVAGTYKNKD